MRKEVIINKHENIYPELFPLDEQVKKKGEKNFVLKN